MSECQGAADSGNVARSSTRPFRWEARCLADDPFAGDFGDGEVALSNKMVTNRKGGTCHTCAGECWPGTRNRVMVERAGGELATYRWCQSCCFAMAVYGRRPSIGDARFALGELIRANLEKEPKG
jgi:RNase P subunit RPR2